MNEYVILEPKGRMLSSMSKMVYLIVFIGTVATFFYVFLNADTLLMENTQLPEQYKEEALWVLRGLCFLIMLHFVRIYITAELLEEPISGFHTRYICNLPCITRFLEQAIRGVMFLFVSLNLLYLLKKTNINVFGTNNHIDMISDLFKYLQMLYIILLSWDIVVAIGNRSFKMLLSPFFAVDIFGLVLCSSIPYIFPEHPIYTVVLFVLLFVSYLVSFVLDIVYNNLIQYLEFSWNIARNLFSPFYGKRYNLNNSMRIYHPINNNITYQGDCSKDTCEFIKAQKNVLVLEPKDTLRNK